MDDQTYRCARIKAAEQDTSVSAPVSASLSDLAQEGSAFEGLKRDEQQLGASTKVYTASDRLPREEFYVHRQ